MSAVENSWVAFDIECVNRRLSPLHLGFVEVVDGRPARRRRWIVRTPGESLHGVWCGGWAFGRGERVTAQDYAAAPLLADAWPQMAEFIAGRPVIAHGAAGRDVAEIRRGCDDAGVPWPRLTFACSLTLARRVWPK